MTEAADRLAFAEVLLEQRRLAGAFSHFQRAEAEGCNPDRCAAGRWMAAMLSGDFAAAWRESDAIRRRGKHDPDRFWQGEDLHGRRVILRCLHGFGDIVQFLRYIPHLKVRAAHLAVECAPRAIDLVRCQPGIDEVITWGLDAPAMPPVWEVQLEIMELPYIFRSTLADLPIATDYLRLPQTELDRAALILGPKNGEPRIGVAWCAGEWNPARSVPLQVLQPVFEHTACQFWNLQGGTVRNEWHTLQRRAPRVRDTPLLADRGLVPLAAVVAQLDLVVTVDTLVAHLAGALSVPCFLLLQHAADWRWMLGRDNSPWYPSLRLFRQPTAGDWPEAVRNLNKTLTAWLANGVEQRSVA